MLRGKIPLILAAVFAVLAGMVAFLAVQSERSAISLGWDPIEVKVAAGDLPTGTVLSRENLRTEQVPRRIVTDTVVTAGKNALSVYGRRLNAPMLRGDLLLFTHVHSPGSDQRLADVVQNKGRAISIRVSPESAVHHQIVPGDRVDVLGTFRDSKTREMVSATLLQNVIVLATGNISGRTNRNLLSANEEAYTTITLQVLPEAGEMLVLSQDLGTLYLTLRSPEDTEIEDLEDTKTTMKTLLTGERAKRISKTQSKLFKGFKVEIIRGNRSETQRVP